MYTTLELFIGGEWIGASERSGELVLNPATGEALGQLPHAMQADLDRVLETSATAFKVWKRMLAVDPRQDHAEGSEGGIEGLEAYTHTKLIVQQ